MNRNLRFSKASRLAKPVLHFGCVPPCLWGFQKCVTWIYWMRSMVFFLFVFFSPPWMERAYSKDDNARIHQAQIMKESHLVFFSSPDLNHIRMLLGLVQHALTSISYLAQNECKSWLKWILWHAKENECFNQGEQWVNEIRFGFFPDSPPARQPTVQSILPMFFVYL